MGKGEIRCTGYEGGICYFKQCDQVACEQRSEGKSCMSLEDVFCKNPKAGVCSVCLRKARRPMGQERSVGAEWWEAREGVGSQVI